MKKKYRICKNEEFAQIVSKRQRLNARGYSLYFRQRSEEYARIGISVSKKLGNAIVRNKIKRQLRMMLQQKVSFASFPYDCVLVVRADYLNFSYQENALELERLLKRLLKKS